MTPKNDTDQMSSQATIATDEAIYNLDPVQREAYEWIARVVSGGMASADVEAMKVWYGKSAAHKAAYSEARGVWQSLGPIASESIRGSDGVAPDRLARAPRVDGAKSPSRRIFLGGAIAASVSYVVVRPPLELWPSYTELMADFRTGVGERRQVTLANRVSLDLNTRTSIAVRSQSDDATQIELLSGEAAISTDATAPSLTIIAGNGRITATEADLNLRCDRSQVSISCLKGRLMVDRGGQFMPLSQHPQVSYNDQEIGAVTGSNPETVTAWQHSLLIFDSTPVDQIIAEVNRYRAGRIVLMNKEIGRRLLTARFKTAETNKIILQIVKIFGATATQLPGNVVLLT
jgi:transmembrane sensor